MEITREGAKILILRTYVELYTRFRELNLIAKGNDIYEAREIRKIYYSFNDIYGLTDRDDEDTIIININKNLNDELTDVSNEYLIELLMECENVSKQYNLNIWYKLSKNIEINEEFIQEVEYIEPETIKLEPVNLEPINVEIIKLQSINEEVTSNEITSEEIAKLKEVRRLLEKDKIIGQKVLDLIDKGSIILEAYDFAGYVDYNGNTQTQNGYSFLNINSPSLISFLILRREAVEIAETIVHEYTHLTLKEKRMTSEDEEIEALITAQLFIKRLINNRSSLTEEQINNIRKNIKKEIQNMRAQYKEGEYNEILNDAYEKRVNPRYIKL